MMICPETFYEMDLKGKSKEEIMGVICDLKQEIENLKDVVENPNYKHREWAVQPSEKVQISCNRDYLERAIQAYEEAGGEYTPSDAEQKSMDFDANVPYIEKVVFSIGGFFGGYKTKTYSIDDDKIHVEVEYSANYNPLALYNCDPTEISKEAFFNSLKDLHIGEWREEYDTSRFGVYIMDGTSWDLEIHFSNGHTPVEIHGSNAYPYNFAHLLDLFEMEI